MKKIEITCACGNTRMLTIAASRKMKLCARCERRERIAKENIVITCKWEGCSEKRTIRSQNIHSVNYCIIHQHKHNAELNKKYVNRWRKKKREEANK